MGFLKWKTLIKTYTFLQKNSKNMSFVEIRRKSYETL